MPRTTVTEFKHPEGYTGINDPLQRAPRYCEELERGGILYFEGIPFDFPRADIEFLLSQKQSSFKGHKNVSYRPKTDLLRGDAGETPEASAKLREVMRDYSTNVTAFLSKFLSPYAGKWTLDFASYRPVEEQNRDLPAAQAERPDARRRLPQPADVRRADPPLLHEHQPLPQPRVGGDRRRSTKSPGSTPTTRGSSD